MCSIIHPIISTLLQDLKLTKHWFSSFQWVPLQEGMNKICATFRPPITIFLMAGALTIKIKRTYNWSCILIAFSIMACIIPCYIWYLAQFSWWFQFSWYTRFSAETVFSHKSSSLPAYVIRIVQEKYLKNIFCEGCHKFNFSH